MNKKYLLLFLLVIFIVSFNNTFSQNISDSIKFKKQIYSAENDNLKQKALIDLYDYQLKFNWFDAINTCKKGIDFFHNSNAEYTSFWYLKIGQIYIEQGLYILSLVNLYTALEIEEKNHLNKGETYLYIAKNYYLQNHFNKSIIIYQKALDEFHKLKKVNHDFASAMIAKTYNKLGIVYDLQGDYTESGKYFKKALKMRLQINRKQDIIDSYTSLGYYFNLQNKYDSANYYFTKGIDKCYKYNNFHYLIDLYLFRSSVYKEQKNYPMAYSSLNAAKKYAFDKEKSGLARIYYYYALTDFAKNNTLAFNKHIDSAFQYVDSFNINSVKLRAYELIIKEKIKLGNYKSAYLHEIELNKLKEINSNDKLLKIENEAKSEIERMKVLNLENSNRTLKSRNRLLLISFFFGILSLLLLSAIIFLNIRKNKLLNKRKTYFKTLFNISPFGIAVIDKFGNIKDVNNALLNILYYPSYDKTIESENIYKIKPLQYSRFIDDFNRVLKTGKQSDTEFSYPYSSGNEVFLRAVNVPIKNNNDEIYLVYSIIEDISIRKKNEEIISKLSEIVKQSTISILTTDNKGNIDYVNPYFSEVFGYTEAEVLGKNPRILKSGLTPEETYKNLWKTIKKGETWRGEFINKTKNGRKNWVNSTIFPLKNQLNNVINYIAFIEDISERKKMQELLEENELKLKESNETKDKFLSIIAHDLKNPFGAIMSLSELLYQNFKKYDETKKENLIRLISEGAKNTYNLLENLLTWARSQKGEIKFLPETLIINKIISENISLLSDLTAKKNISVIFESNQEITGFVDFNMLNFIIRNLFTNAIKFTPKDGHIKFSLEKSDKKITVCIEDTGTGMDKDQIDSLFKIEQTSSQRGTENETGTGLGLILCKDFIGFHKGKIRVQSELGKGSTFCIEIPR
ncbi:MAG: PAS domain S-box protein [Chlorobi bacterium]|nr:PAS domain S-box protein [Chlorobiota bacterium]